MSSFLSRAAFTLLACAVAASGLDAEAAGARRTHEIQPEDYFSLQLIHDCATAPDGQHIAFTNLVWGGEDEGRQFDVWVVDTDTQDRTRLTFSAGNDLDPQWSTDSSMVYFLSRRSCGEGKAGDGASQVFRKPICADAPPFQVTRAREGVMRYRLSNDSSTLYYTSCPRAEGSEPAGQITRLYGLDLESWREEMLVEAAGLIIDFDVAGDQTRIAVVVAPAGEEEDVAAPTRLDVHQVSTGKRETVADAGREVDADASYGRFAEPCWSPSGHALAWTVISDGRPTEVLVAEWTKKGTQVRTLDRPREIAVSGHLRWFPGSDELCLLGEFRGRRRAYGIADVRDGGQGELRTFTRGHIVVHDFDFNADGSVVDYVMSEPDKLRDLFRKVPDAPRARERQITRMNPQADGWKLPQVKRVTWMTTDGRELEGIVELPFDYDEDDQNVPLPLVVQVRGDDVPAGMYHWHFGSFGRTLVPASGYAVLCPNYRSSTGYGDESLMAAGGGEYDLVIQDIMTGIKALADIKLVDPDRVVLVGWGRGGLIVSRMIAEDNPFKTAVVAFGINDKVIDFGPERAPRAVSDHLLGMNRERTEAYLDALDPEVFGQVRTPVLYYMGNEATPVSAVANPWLDDAPVELNQAYIRVVDHSDRGHGRVLKRDRLEALKAMMQWLEDHLAEKGK